MSSNAPVRVRLRYASFDDFIERFAPNVTRGGVFLASRTPPPVGTTFAFEIQLAGGEVALAGDGKVTWIKPYDPRRRRSRTAWACSSCASTRRRASCSSRSWRARRPPARARCARRCRASLGRAQQRRQRHRRRRPRVDTSVDLAAEFGVDEARLRRAVDRNWLGAGKAAGEMDELENLLKPDTIEQVSVAQALAGLPRLLDPTPAAA